LTLDFYEEKISKACKNIYPLTQVTVRKVKVLKRAKIDGKYYHYFFEDIKNKI
jgi:ribosomal protein S3AE